MGAAASVLVVLLAAGASSVGAREAFVPARGCVHAGGAVPGWYLWAGEVSGYEAGVGAVPCRFAAVAPGGVSAAGPYVLTIERGDDVVVHRGDGGCADDVIAEGDLVTLEATAVAEAGADSGC